MRIIAGEYKSRRLAAPRGMAVRPTSDRAREALFSVLGESVRGIAFLDLFAGTGAVGLEALSRGAASVTFVEKDPRGTLLHRNIEALGLADRCRVMSADWDHSCRRLTHEGARFGIVFADPPYDSGLAEACLRSPCAGAILRPGGRLVVEHRRKESLPEPAAPLVLARQLEAGEAVFSIYLKEHGA